MFQRSVSVLFACWLAVIAGQGAAAQEPKQGPAGPQPPQFEEKGGKAPGKIKFRQVFRDGQWVIEQDDNFKSNRPQFTTPVNPSGRNPVARDLAEGNPLAWAAIVGMPAALFLGLGAGMVRSKKPGTIDPAQIVATWQKRRELCFATLAGAVVMIILGVLIALALLAPYVMFFVWIPVLFVATVVSVPNWRCPACETAMGNNYSPAFCPKCGVPLMEKSPPTPEGPPPPLNQPPEPDTRITR